MIFELLTEHHLEKEAAEAHPSLTRVKMSNCWKSHAAAQISFHVAHITISLF